MSPDARKVIADEAQRVRAESSTVGLRPRVDQQKRCWESTAAGIPSPACASVCGFAVTSSKGRGSVVKQFRYGFGPSRAEWLLFFGPMSATKARQIGL